MVDNRFYVYMLIDPRTELPFYIGKGSGNRIKAHLALVRNGRVDNPRKCLKIKQIIEAGLDVGEEIICSGMTKSEALQLERSKIAEYRDDLTNIERGNRRHEEGKAEMARFWLSRLKSFARWMRECPRQVGWVRSEFGDPGAFYEKFVDHLRQVAEIR